MCYFVNRESDTTFCEECECWTKKMDGLRIAAVEDSVLTQALEEEEYALIAQQASQEINLGNYVSLIGYACPKCRETNYLTASTVQLVLGKNGYEYQIRLFVKPIAVPRDVIELTQYLYQQAEKAEREANQQISAQSEPDETTV